MILYRPDIETKVSIYETTENNVIPFYSITNSGIGYNLHKFYLCDVF